METLRKTSIKALINYLGDARDLHSKYGNPGKASLKRLLEPVNGSPNPERIKEMEYLFGQYFISDLEEWICLLEDEIEHRRNT